MIKDTKAASEIIARAMQEYTQNNVSEELMHRTRWLTSEDKFTFEFELMDMTDAESEKLAEGETGLTGWKKSPKHLLTVYVDKKTGNTFIRRFVKTYPWENIV